MHISQTTRCYTPSPAALLENRRHQQPTLDSRGQLPQDKSSSACSWQTNRQLFEERIKTNAIQSGMKERLQVGVLFSDDGGRYGWNTLRGA